MSERTPPEEQNAGAAQPTEEQPAVGEQQSLDTSPAVEEPAAPPTEIAPVPDTTAVPEGQWAPPEPQRVADQQPAAAYAPPPADDARSASGDGDPGPEEPASTFDAPPWTPADAGPGHPELLLGAAFLAGLAIAILLRRRAG